jgi:hypothetical protein
MIVGFGLLVEESMGDCAKPSSVVEAEYKVGNGILGVEFLDLVVGYAS